MIGEDDNFDETIWYRKSYPSRVRARESWITTSNRRIKRVPTKFLFYGSPSRFHYDHHPFKLVLIHSGKSSPITRRK